MHGEYNVKLCTFICVLTIKSPKREVLNKLICVDSDTEFRL
jgi:hypothetical protein